MVNDRFILKSDGEQELFDREKLRASLRRSGASTMVANEISDSIESERDSIKTTDEIYKIAFAKLKKLERRTAMRYSLKRSLFSIGPTGFPFETYVAKLLAHKGYTTKTGLLLRGKCVEHEIDVVAYDTDDLIMVEAKFHNDVHLSTDTKVALYVKARYDDLKDSTFDIDGQKRRLTNGILLTNTTFTTTAIAYAECAGLELISWDYPQKGNLYDLIETSGIYPLTCLMALSKKEKARLITAGVLNVSDISSNIELLKEMGISDKKISELLEEVELICRT